MIDEVCAVPSKRIRNKLAGFATVSISPSCVVNKLHRQYDRIWR